MVYRLRMEKRWNPELVAFMKLMVNDEDKVEIPHPRDASAHAADGALRV